MTAEAIAHDRGRNGVSYGRTANALTTLAEAQGMLQAVANHFDGHEVGSDAAAMAIKLADACKVLADATGVK